MGDNALIQKLSGVDERSEEFVNSIESALALENEELLEEVTALKDELLETKDLAEQRDRELQDQIRQTEEIRQIAEQNQEMVQETRTQIQKLKQEKVEIQKKSQEIIDANERQRQQGLLIIKRNLDKQAHKYAQRRLVLFIFLIFVFFLLAIIANHQFGWGTLEPWTYIIGLLVFALSYIYFAVKKKEFSPRALYDDAVNRKKTQFYQEYGVNLDELETYEERKL